MKEEEDVDEENEEYVSSLRPVCLFLYIFASFFFGAQILVPKEKDTDKKVVNGTPKWLDFGKCPGL